MTDVRVSEHASLDDMLDHEDPQGIGYPADTTRDEMLARVRTIYPPEKEALGVLVIEVGHADVGVP